jgi:hypothetical protein
MMETRMPRTIHTLLALLLLGPTPALEAQEPATFLLIVGSDTISRERFSRTGTQLEAELVSQVLGARFRFTIEFGADGAARRMTNAFWLPADADTAPARQRATFDFPGDSAIVQIEGGGTQRLATRLGAVPYLNPSFSVLELMLLRAARIGGDSVSVPAFLVQGGQTVPLVIVRQGADTMLLNLGGALARLRVDSAHRILGGEVPSQNLRIVRQTGARGPLRERPPDYAAPRDAPYAATEVEIPTPMGHVLAGTLTLPFGSGPGRRVPAVITSTGSGPHERDEAIPGVSGYRPFRQLADTLSRHGIAVLRMDDRGHGASGGRWAGATTADFADDIRAGLAWLRRHPAIDAARLGVIGHSEGGIVAPMVAAGDSTLRAIVLLAAPARLGRRVIQFQQRQAIDGMTGVSAGQRDSIFMAAQVSLDSLARLDPWMRYYLDLDPLTHPPSIRKPAVLIVQGATDRQVTADQAAEWEAAFKAAGNPNVTVRTFPEANHLLIQDPDGHPAGYARLPHRAVRADILGAVLDWLRGRLDA